MGLLIEIHDVQLVTPPPAPLRGFHVDAPKPGRVVEAGGLDVVGWVLAADGAIERVEAVSDGEVVGRWRLGAERPDLEAAFPGVLGARRAGFRGNVDLSDAHRQTRLELRAVDAAGRRIRFASIIGVRRWRESRSPAERDLVSVVIPCFVQAHFVAEAIESVLAQSYPHVEIVVVDDGSPDNTAAVAGRYPGVRYIRQENRGLAAARNTGIRHSNGDFLVFLDADDRLLPDAVDTGVALLRAHPEAAFASGHYAYIGQDGGALPTPVQQVVERDHYAGFLRTNLAGMPGTVVLRRAVFEYVGGFDESFRACEDYDLYLRITRRFPVVCHGHVVGQYRQHEASMSRGNEVMLDSALSALAAQRPYVRGSRELRRAYHDGRRFWRDYFGSPLTECARAAISRHDWRPAMRAALVLARRHPRGLLRLATNQRA